MDKGALSIALTSAVLSLFATIIVLLRCWSRKIAHDTTGIDDVFMLLALLLTCGACVICIIGAAHAQWGRYEIYEALKNPTIPFPSLELDLQLFYALQWTQLCALALIKFSALLFYHGINPHVLVCNTFSRAHYYIGLYIFSYSGIVAFIYTFQCIPTQLPSGGGVDNNENCLTIAPNFYTAAAWANIMGDALLLLFAIPALFQSTFVRNHKATTVVWLLSAFMTMYAGVMRGYTYWIDLSYADDGSYTSTSPFIWTIVELCAEIIGASLPSCPPAFDRLWAICGGWLGGSGGDDPGPEAEEEAGEEIELADLGGP